VRDFKVMIIIMLLILLSERLQWDSFFSILLLLVLYCYLSFVAAGADGSFCCFYHRIYSCAVILRVSHNNYNQGKYK